MQNEPKPTRTRSDADAGEEALEHGDLPASAVPDPKLQADAKKGQKPGKSGQPPDDDDEGLKPDPDNVG